MNIGPTSLLRHAKRAVFSGGYSQPVHKYLTRVASQTDRGIHPADGTYLINLSFDFELSITTYFWDADFKNTKRVGELALEYLFPSVALLENESIPFNIQIVGGLLDPHISTSSLFSDAHREFIEKNPTLFTLPETLVTSLHSPDIDVGIHGHSHRMFTTLTREEAKEELGHATSLFKNRLPDLPAPTFMAYPRNHWAHTDILTEFGITSWRGGSLVPHATGEMPLGIWFAPGNLNVTELERFLTHIQKTQPGYLLHLWNHFTEVDPKTLETMIAVMKNTGWEFTNVRNFMHRYG